jgi:MerR family copper efflux transcriptional regulator
MIGRRMTIGDVARRTGVSIKALRFYDELGILQVAGRSESNYRVFGDGVLECVERIRRFQDAGLTLREVQELVRCARAGDEPEEFLREAYAKALDRIQGEIAALEAKRQRLLSLLAMPDEIGVNCDCGHG